jgi:hypothetical protein
VEVGHLEDGATEVRIILNQIPVSKLYSTVTTVPPDVTLNTQQMSTECIYGFRMIPRVNSCYFPIQR